MVEMSATAAAAKQELLELVDRRNAIMDELSKLNWSESRITGTPVELSRLDSIGVLDFTNHWETSGSWYSSDDR